jgi:hypothetical protein
MKIIQIVSLQIRRFVCYFSGHIPHKASLASVGLTVCLRCRRVDRRTVRARITRGEIEKRMATYTPTGYQFVDCNWKKRTARFVSPTGTLKFVSC